MHQAIWSSKSVGADQSAWQRNLQREYVNRLSVILLRAATVRADTRSTIREQAKTTVRTLKQPLRHGAASAAEQAAWEAHRADCLGNTGTRPTSQCDPRHPDGVRHPSSAQPDG